MMTYLHLSPQLELREQLREMRELVRRAENCRDARATIGLGNIAEADRILDRIEYLLNNLPR